MTKTPAIRLAASVCDGRGLGTIYLVNRRGTAVGDLVPWQAVGVHTPDEALAQFRSEGLAVLLCGIKGARRETQKLLPVAEAEAAARRWRSSNSTGDYFAEVIR